MEDQLDSLKKLLGELNTEENPLKLVLVDWASESQHKNGDGTPLRDSLDVPVLHSPFWTSKDSIIKSWCSPASEDKEKEELESASSNSPQQWLESLILLDKEGKAIAGYPLNEGNINGKEIDFVDLNEEKSYQLVKGVLSQALEKAMLQK